jgi:hypothetical protein
MLGSGRIVRKTRRLPAVCKVELRKESIQSPATMICRPDKWRVTEQHAAEFSMSDKAPNLSELIAQILWKQVTQEILHRIERSKTPHDLEAPITAEEIVSSLLREPARSAGSTPDEVRGGAPKRPAK